MWKTERKKDANFGRRIKNNFFLMKESGIKKIKK